MRHCPPPSRRRRRDDPAAAIGVAGVSLHRASAADPGLMGGPVQDMRNRPPPTKCHRAVGFSSPMRSLLYHSA
jgi:hypothetical protein